MDTNSMNNTNNTNYPLKVEEEMSQYYKQYNLQQDNESKQLHYYQYIIKKFFENNDQRGLLINYKMGYGKTLVATSIAASESNRKIRVLLPKSLENNFVETVKKYSPDADLSRYKFISSNASNMYKQVERLGYSEEQLELFMKYVTNGGRRQGGDSLCRQGGGGVSLCRQGGDEPSMHDNPLDDSLLIVDEAHNLFNSICNGSKNGVALYDLVMKAKNIKILFLTGTPIINKPFELVPCYNMLRGYIYDNTDEQRYTLFSEDMSEFNDFFVDMNNMTIKNKDKFMNRIYGSTSSYGTNFREYVQVDSISDDIFSEVTNNKTDKIDKTDKHKQNENFPETYPMKVERVYMSEDQYSNYLEARMIEKRMDNNKKFKNDNVRFGSTMGKVSSYRVKSRQISNYAYVKITSKNIDTEDEVYIDIKDKNKDKDKDKDKTIVPKNIDIDKAMPKVARMLKNIENYPNSSGLIYSEFVETTITTLESILVNKVGYSKFILDEYQNLEDLGFKKTKKKVFAILTGSVLVEDRIKIQDIFNSKENINGDVISLLIISSAGAEGLDLKNIRHVHIFEPFWNYARVLQIISRAARYQSHIALEKSKRNVQPYIYLCDYPKSISDIRDKKRKEHPELFQYKEYNDIYNTLIDNKDTYNEANIRANLSELEDTTDIVMYVKSVKNMKIINTFLHTIIEASVDCRMHCQLNKEICKVNNIECFSCNPNNKKLYLPNISVDIKWPSNCTPISEEKIKLKKIVVNNTDVYYDPKASIDDIKIYWMDPTINKIVEMPKNDTYSDALTYILTSK